MWLNQRRQGWRSKQMENKTPMFEMYLTNKILDCSQWAGSLFHQVMSFTLTRLHKGLPVDNAFIRETAHELANQQFKYSQNNIYLNEIPSKAPMYRELSVYLVLSEHYHRLDETGLLSQVQAKVDDWLCNTFSWEHWDWVVSLVKNNPVWVEIEPENRHFYVSDVRISARMDLGIETRQNKFFIFDWKCQQTEEQLLEYQLDKYRRQLLVYATWPIYRDFKPLPIENVMGIIFNPTDGRSYRFAFTEKDIQDFELEMHDWKRLHQMMFSSPEDVIFDELSEPNSPETVCPHCQFQTICKEPRSWHMLK